MPGITFASDCGEIVKTLRRTDRRREVASARSIAESGTCGGTVLTDDADRLVVDGLPIGSVNSFAVALDKGEGVEMIHGYEVPLDAEEIILEAGASEGTTAQIPIPRP